ncbi:MAG: hypothetical protein BRC29_01740 [Nanohaloarchaea archaeon SW_7_43_1]|nr:MAG: hypothetical protein BRC29_01740 [Nanohaloarchaea archaeon SW_7_43_1]
MLDEDIEEKILDESKLEGLVTPHYNKYNFANIPGTIEELLDVKSERDLPETVFEGIDTGDVQNVALVFVDAFGYVQWKKYGQDLEFFSNLIENGKVTPLTAVFPSETAAAVTSMNTGLTPQEHSIVSWRVFLEGLDTTIRTLPFTTLDREDPREIMGDTDISVLYDGETVFERLSSGGVDSTAIVPDAVIGSDYNSKMMKESAVKGFNNTFDMALKLRKSLESSDNREYLHCYTDQVDKALHELGPDSEEHISQLEAVSQALQKQLVEKTSDSVAEDTLLIIIADHGQADVDPDNIEDLLSFETVEKNLERDQKGEIILPTGGPRTAILHIKSGKEDRVKEFLDQKLNAEVLKTEEAVELDLFGKGEVNNRSRLGDIVVIPRKEEKMVWYNYEDYKTYEDYHGHHGGMSKAEMLVPFAAAKISDLKE